MTDPSTLPGTHVSFTWKIKHNGEYADMPEGRLHVASRRVYVRGVALRWDVFWQGNEIVGGLPTVDAARKRAEAFYLSRL